MNYEAVCLVTLTQKYAKICLDLLDIKISSEGDKKQQQGEELKSWFEINENPHAPENLTRFHTIVTYNGPLEL